MSTPTPVRLASLPEAAVELLRAVHDALDIPLPGLTDKDEHAHTRLLETRAREARVTLATVLDQGHEVGPAARTLRVWTAQCPVAYTPWIDDGGAA
ncbi:hypothetical protein [Streptomyces sp. WMMC905]|uniref:hypothetical protein n=1 Tax=Streptomyces sp. WMMC905 TaxID=3404123 RepID=UPI003B9665DF